ncbi:hypothetical protein WJX73_006292 [Symbiochloris irregularis]|uniref:Uncharacterized protein n=1 Tax=Symbiochloris irregularis TaxID=706552 RepID=A0AAW1P444_9CHLO
MISDAGRTSLPEDSVLGPGCGEQLAQCIDRLDLEAFSDALKEAYKTYPDNPPPEGFPAQGRARRHEREDDFKADERFALRIGCAPPPPWVIILIININIIIFIFLAAVFPVIFPSLLVQGATARDQLCERLPDGLRLKKCWAQGPLKADMRIVESPYFNGYFEGGQGQALRYVAAHIQLVAGRLPTMDECSQVLELLALDPRLEDWRRYCAGICLPSSLWGTRGPALLQALLGPTAAQRRQALDKAERDARKQDKAAAKAQKDAEEQARKHDRAAVREARMAPRHAVAEAARWYIGYVTAAQLKELNVSYAAMREWMGKNQPDTLVPVSKEGKPLTGSAKLSHSHHARLQESMAPRRAVAEAARWRMCNITAAQLKELNVSYAAMREWMGKHQPDTLVPLSKLKELNVSYNAMREWMGKNQPDEYRLAQPPAKRQWRR